MSRYIWTRVLIAVVATAMLGNRPTAGQFLDVSDTDWYSEAVRSLSEHGAISGRRTTVGFFFQPAEPINRAEFAKLIIASLFTTRPCPPTEQVFSDIDLDHWASPWIHLASRLGIMEGQGGWFVPSNLVSRAEAAKIVAVALDLVPSSSNSPFIDVQSDDWFAPYVLAVYQEGLMKGYGGDLFRPEARINRAEGAVLAYAAMKKRKEKEREPKIAITAYRPISHWMDELVASRESNLAGIGIRLNAEPDSLNLQRVRVKAGPILRPSNIRYFLSRNNNKINVWLDRERASPALVEVDRFEMLEDEVVQGIDLFVENVISGESILRIDVQAGDIKIASDRVRFVTVDSLVIALGGEFQDVSTWRNDSNLGTFHTANRLYDLGYDTLVFGEYHVDNDETDRGKGIVYDAIFEAVKHREVKRLALFGYSHGGGSLRNVLERVEIDKENFGEDFEIVYAAYIDGVANPGPFSETEPPPLANTFVNIFQPDGDDPVTCPFDGVSISGAREIRVTDFSWGESLTHCSIDDDEHVRSTLVDDIQEVLGCGLVAP